MHLGASKVPAHVTADWAEEAAAEAEAEESSHANPWGNDDLMDVNADQDDWSEYLGGIELQQTLMSVAGAFESAPSVTVTSSPSTSHAQLNSSHLQSNAGRCLVSQSTTRL